MKHSQRGFEAEQYTIPRDTSLSEQEELQRYEFRCVQESNLVRVHQVERVNVGQQQAGGYRVRTERIIARLSELKELGFEQGLYILREALVGYRTILQLRGPVAVTDKMIGVSQQGKVKVWVNENFAKCSPEQKDLQPTTEIAMVDAIYNLVGRRLKNGAFPNVFRQTYEQVHIRNFHHVLQMIGQFAASNNLHLPDRLNLTPISPQKPAIVTNGSLPVGVRPPQLQHVNQQSQLHVVSHPVLPLQGSHVAEQVFRQPSNIRREIHQEIHQQQQQRVVVTPRINTLQISNGKPVTPSPINHPTQVVTTTETIVQPNLIARNVVTPVHGQRNVVNGVLLSDRNPVSPRPVVSRSPIR